MDLGNFSSTFPISLFLVVDTPRLFMYFYLNQMKSQKEARIIFPNVCVFYVSLCDWFKCLVQLVLLSVLKLWFDEVAAIKEAVELDLDPPPVEPTLSEEQLHVLNALLSQPERELYMQTLSPTFELGSTWYVSFKVHV